jgi:hypothetical protein
MRKRVEQRGMESQRWWNYCKGVKVAYSHAECPSLLPHNPTPEALDETIHFVKLHLLSRDMHEQLPYYVEYINPNQEQCNNAIQQRADSQTNRKAIIQNAPFPS